jgi:hypothetical protein
MPPPWTPGRLIVPSDIDAEAAILNDTTGVLIENATLSMCEVGDILPDGTFALGRTDVPLGQITHLDIYDRDGTLIIAVPYDDIFPEAPANQAWAFAPIRGDGNDTFYVVDDKGGLGAPDPIIRKVHKSGAVSGTTYHPVGDGFGTRISAMAPSRDGAYIYYALDAVGTAIYRLRTSDDTDLGAWVAGIPGSAIYFDIYTLASGDVLVLIQPDTAVNPAEWEVRRYNSSGVLQATYTLPAGEDESFIFIALDHGDSTVFWARTFPNDGGGGATDSKFYEIRLSDGVVLTEFAVTNTSGGGDVPVSCPFFVVPPTEVVTPPTITDTTPVSCPVDSPQRITITGSGFADDPDITVTDESGNPVSYTLISASATEIVIEVAFDACGTWTIDVDGTEVSVVPDEICVTSPVTLPCWNGGGVQDLSCVNAHAQESAPCFNAHSIDHLRVTLNGEGQP